MALQRQWIASPNYSGRGGSQVRLIVLHTSEGAQDFTSLGSYFQGNVEASSHVGIDNRSPGLIGEYVKRGNKAWTQANANPVCVAAELCTPAGAAAGWSRDYWLSVQTTMLDNAAAWVAEEAAAFGIPLVALSASQAQGSGRGVCQHNDLGSWGGGHYDCGKGFPLDYVLSKAGGGGGGPTPPPGGSAPPLSVDYFGPAYGHNSQVPDVRTWQAQMSARGWTLDVDQVYGPGSEQVCRQFQSEKGLGVDGMVGPQTWAATWTAPVT
ncbi:MAG TPA: peptidoglycan-binding domain-containing protein [Streptosporangiaceae bacterium]|jgi:hypothetical protein